MSAEPAPAPAADPGADSEPPPDIPAGRAAGAEAEEPAATSVTGTDPVAATEPGTPADEPATAERADTAETADATSGTDGTDSTTDVAGADGTNTRAPRGKRTRGRQITAVSIAVAAVVAAGVLVATSHHSGSDTDAKRTVTADGLPHTAVDASPGSCGQGWGGKGQARPRPGTQVFDLHNSTTDAIEVYLIDARSGKIFGELEGLAPTTSRPMLVDLGSGTYAFKCLQEDTDAVTGPSVTVPGTTPQGPGSLPVNQHDLIPPTLAYQTWIGARIAELAHDTGRLKADIDGGDLAAARRDWLTGHLVYERMGAAYDTFGDADGVINGTASLAPGGTDDPGFTGFHRIEYGLWHGRSAAELRGPAATLDKAVRGLLAGWSGQRMDPASMGLRAHEIIENTEQFELTGRTDYGSGTNLATARANIDGTREILGKLRSLLVARDPDTAGLDASLARAAADLDTQHHGGRWTPLDRLTRARRERINADFGDLLERLASVAAIFDVRRTA